MNDIRRNLSRAVITGPTGAIGMALCQLLVDQGIEVWAVVRPGSPRADRLDNIEGVRVVRCDIAALSGLAEAIDGADAFFHLAWAKTTGAGRNDMFAQIDNLRYTIEACRAAKALGCRVFIGAGSQAEYGRFSGALKPTTPCFPENGYGMAKLCAGQMSRAECEALGIDHIWSRILSVYGPYDGETTMIMRAIGALLAGEAPSLTAGEQIWDYLYVADAAEALYRMAVYGKSGAVYTLGSGKARQLRDYIGTLRDAIDPRLPLGFGKIPYSPKQVMHLEADIRALTTDTGFMPQTDFARGIRETIEWVKKRGV